MKIVLGFMVWMTVSLFGLFWIIDELSIISERHIHRDFVAGAKWYAAGQLGAPVKSQAFKDGAEWANTAIRLHATPAQISGMADDHNPFRDDDYINRNRLLPSFLRGLELQP